MKAHEGSMEQYEIFIRGNGLTLYRIFKYCNYEILKKYKDKSYLVKLVFKRPITLCQAANFIKDNASDSSLLLQFKDEYKNVDFLYSFNGQVVRSISLLKGTSPQIVDNHREYIMRDEMNLTMTETRTTGHN